jgi:hypothetical protein
MILSMGMRQQCVHMECITGSAIELIIPPTKDMTVELFVTGFFKASRDLTEVECKINMV